VVGSDDLIAVDAENPASGSSACLSDDGDEDGRLAAVFAAQALARELDARGRATATWGLCVCPLE
jgi:hypothetical protein